METENISENQSPDMVQSHKAPRVNLNKRRIGQKLLYIIIEIMIIVVAVNLSIWLNNKNNQKNEDKQALIFLSGLKQDIKSDLKEIDDNLEFYRTTKFVYTYLSQLDRAREVNTDTFKIAFGMIGTNSWLMPNRSRY